MSTYSIHTLWFWRRNEEGPELLEAWDDFSVDANYEGWQQACAKALTSVETDMGEFGHRYFVIRVDAEKIEQAFYPAEIAGEVKPA